MTELLPPLPTGFSSRYATMLDVEMAAEMGIEYAMATTGFSDMDASSLRNQWETPGFDPGRDAYFVLTPDGALAGYTEVWADQTPPVHPFIWGAVAPEFQGLGIGSHLLAWGEQRAGAVLAAVPLDIRVAPVAGAPSVINSAKELLQNNGWTYIRSYYSMQIDLDSAPPAAGFPAQITVRTFRPEDAEAVFRAVDESFSDHYGHVEQPFESGFARFRHHQIDDPIFNASLWFLAMAGEEIAGVALCRQEAPDDPECGYVSILGVRRPWRGQGLGLALLREAFGEFHRKGYRKVSLGVDAQNITGALRLYEKAGMHVIRQMDVYEKEFRPGRELRVQEIEE